MKGQQNLSARVAYLQSTYRSGRDRERSDHHRLRHLGLRLSTALAVFLLPQIVVMEMAFSQTPAPTPAPTSSNDSGEQSLLLRPTLKTGSQGAEVTELQAVLQLLGFFADTVNGIYGQSTTQAVSQFQQAAGLTPDGIVGPATWNRLLPPTPVLTNVPGTVGTAPDGFPMPTASPTSTPTPSGSAQPTPATSGSDRPATNQTAANPTPAALPILRVGMQGTAVTGLQERLRALGLLKASADGVFGAETLAAVKAAQRQFSLEADGVVGPATWEALLR
ncbi:MAG TPA: peptidoglycan-binding protein [Microcoleaceae cyanobacterium]